MKRCFRLVTSLLLLLAYFEAKSQITYFFPTVYSPASCTFTYEISTTITLDSVQVTNIYFDDGTTGSFAFKTFVSYSNTFTNSTLDPGNFYTYDLAIYSSNPNLATPEITNNLGTVPLQTAAAGSFSPQNNPTFTGSASALGLQLNAFYSSPALLEALGYDSARLHINLPCLDTTITNGDLAALPVLWSNLAATVREQTVQLAWQTFMEQNNSGFSIERSFDAVNWTKIGFLPSKAAGGNSSEALSYRYEDNELDNGRYYYRITQRDFDGKTEVSNIAVILISGQRNRKELIVYPNPAQKEIYLKNIPTNTAYIIFDNNGRIVSRGNYQNRVDVQRLTPGLYWIQVEGKASRFLLK